jgi:hypothetical protein
MAGVFGYGVTTDVLIAGGRARFLYVVRAETPEEAYRIVRQTVSEGSDVGETCYPLSELDFGQFSLLGNGRFAGISDAGGNFRTVPGASGTH